LYSDLIYQISLSLVPNIGDVHAKALLNYFGDAQSIFKAGKKELEDIEGIGTVRAKSIKDFTNFKLAEDEAAFIEKYKISALFINNKNYPQRLLNCYDSPIILYYRGTANLNAQKIISIVGTRNNHEYGKSVCEKIITDLSGQDILIVSGLAFGIDSIAHKSALKNNLKTVGILAHGLDRIYPSQNKLLAKQMIEEGGGLLTDFKSGTKPDKQNFPKRNRIVAGMSDAVVVIESGLKGGSLITAELANGYNKDVFAIPGRISDAKNEGCNYLIKNNKAALITSADDLLENMQWKEKKVSAKKQRELFIELSTDEKIIINILQQQPQVHIDEIYVKSGLNSSSVAAALLTLEMQGVVSSMPGKMYNIL
jgi:DNA processing protein